MNTPPDFKSLQEEVQKALVSVVKSTNRIAAEDLTFQRTINPDAAEQLDEKSARILQLSTKLLQSAARACGIKAPKLEDVEDVEMRWQSVVDVVDSVLEKADTALDEYTGLVKRKEPSTTETVRKTLSSFFCRDPIWIGQRANCQIGSQRKTTQIYSKSYSKCQCCQTATIV